MLCLAYGVFHCFVTFDCLLWAVAVVLYTDCTSFPHRCSPTGSVLSFSHNSTFLSLAVRACMYARLVSLDFSTLGLFPVAVAENSIRNASVGGVAASKTLFFACTYTHLLHAHFTAHIRTPSCVCTYTCGSSAWKGSLHVRHISPSRLLPSHVSSILAVPWRSLRDHSRLRPHRRSRPHVLSVLTRLKSAGHAPLRTCIAKFGYPTKSDAQKVRQEYFRGWWHDAHQRSGPEYLRLLENHEREHKPIRCSHSVWILCFARFSLVMQSGNRC